MNKFDANPATAEDRAEPGDYRDSSAIRYRARATASDERLAELEVENSRLHRLVAELLLKNQQLRKPD